MLSQNEVIIAAAGGRKTTRIVQRAASAAGERAAIVTFTNNNTDEIRRALLSLGNSLPPHLEVSPWFTFLLHEMARPYQRSMISKRIDGFAFVSGRSTQGIAKSNVERYYFADGMAIYSDKIADFVCACNSASGGAVIRRLEQRFDHIYVDEVQDLCGYDLDILELILRSRIRLTLVGDHRQATLRTNFSSRNKQYVGRNIAAKFQEWKKAGLLEVRHESETWRSNQAIADLADQFFPSEPRTKSNNVDVTGHDGVFAILPEEVDEYVKLFNPRVLRLNKTTECAGLAALNFGLSKGLGFDRVLIFPHKKGIKWLVSGSFSHVEKSAEELYVGTTRARYSVAFVLEKDTKVPGITRFKKAAS